MYLRGLSGPADRYQITADQARNPNTACAPGYVLETSYWRYLADGRGDPAAAVYQCVRTSPDQVQSQQPAINSVINVSVPTNVATEVSPQISPIFTQQDNPVDSPVSAGTQKDIETVTNPAQTQNDPAIARQIALQQQEILRQQQEQYNQQRADEESRREAFWLAINQKSSNDVIPVIPNQSDNPSTINVSAPAPIVVTSPGGVSNDATPSASIPTPFGPVSFPAESFQKAAPWVAAALIGLLIYYGSRRN